MGASRRLGDDDVTQREQTAACVDDAAYRVDAHRAVPIVLRVVFTRPHHFHRRLDRVGDRDRFLDVVRLKAPPEAAAEHRRVDDAFLER